jgi:hypothetical protein
MNSNFRASLTLDQPRNSKERISVLYSELLFALSRVENIELKRWGLRAAKRLPTLFVRRIGGAARLVTLVTRGGSKEFGDLLSAYRQGQMTDHLATRSADAIDGSIFLARDGIRTVLNVARAFLRDPKTTAIVVMSGLIGFEAGSGGLDGNGGIPDLDLMAGIGAHRSPITHSIIAGVVFEGSVFAIADLAKEIYDRFPVSHDPLWDEIARIGSPAARTLTVGTSAGVAYHLLVDAFVQPGTYHDIPIHMPIEAHETIFAANGITEGNDAVSRAQDEYTSLVGQPSPHTKTAGQKIVQSTQDAYKAASRRLWGNFKGSNS